MNRIILWLLVLLNIFSGTFAADVGNTYHSAGAVNPVYFVNHYRTCQERIEWAQKRLWERYAISLKTVGQIADEYGIPPRLLMTVVLNEQTDFSDADIAQDNIYTGWNGSHGMVQLQPERINRHRLHTYPLDGNLSTRIWNCLSDSVCAMRFAALEIRFILNKMNYFFINFSSSNDFTRSVLFGPIPDPWLREPYNWIRPIPATGNYKYLSERTRREAALARAVTMAYNTETVIEKWEDIRHGPLFGEHWRRPEAPFFNAAVHGANAQNIWAICLADPSWIQQPRNYDAPPEPAPTPPPRVPAYCDPDNPLYYGNPTSPFYHNAEKRFECLMLRR